VEAVNLACSGAKAENLWPSPMGGKVHFGEAPQADQLAALARRDDVRMIVVTVGANDLGFGSLVVKCALDWAKSSPGDPALCHDDAQAALATDRPAMEQSVRRVFLGVRQTMAAAGYRRTDYRLVAMGYASPFPQGARFRYPEDGWSRLTDGGCPLWNADAD